MKRSLTRVRPWRRQQEGRWGYILAWLLGVPIPILKGARPPEDFRAD